MSDYLYSNFLHEPMEYENAEEHWQAFWRKLISELGENTLWQEHFFSTKFADGTPCRDGNPIFSAICHLRGLAIRIIQVEPEDNPGEFSFWTDNVGEEDSGLRELVIVCVLTLDTIAMARGLIAQWVQTGRVDIECEIALSQSSGNREYSNRLAGLRIPSIEPNLATSSIRDRGIVNGPFVPKTMAISKPAKNNLGFLRNQEKGERGQHFRSLAVHSAPVGMATVSLVD